MKNERKQCVIKMLNLSKKPPNFIYKKLNYLIPATEKLQTFGEDITLRQVSIIISNILKYNH